MRVAIFVEGQTELILTREILLKYYEYTNISIEYRTLFTDTKMQRAEYDYSNKAAGRFFQIINVGNDNAVLSRILKREVFMWNAGYDIIVGLRDMYSSDYRKFSSKIDAALNEKFLEVSKETIKKRSQRPERIVLCFAIMETEAWILGMEGLFERLSPELTPAHIEEHLGIPLRDIDPETTFFHPAKVVETIYALVGKRYRKKKGDIEAITHFLDRERIVRLKDATRCNSFSTFLENLFS